MPQARRASSSSRSNIGIKYDYPELEHPVKGIYVYSPDHKTKVLFEGEGYTLNRKLVPQKQVKDAKGFGVEFKFGATAERLIAEDGYIRGVDGPRQGRATLQGHSEDGHRRVRLLLGPEEVQSRSTATSRGR